MKKFREWLDFKPGPVQKLGLKMKLSLILIIGVIFQLHAETSFSQESAISLNLKSATVLEVIETIESNSEYRFFYSREDIDLEKKVSVYAKEEKIEVILHELFSQLAIKFTIIDRQIILVRKPLEKLTPVGLLNQPKSQLLTKKYKHIRVLPILDLSGIVRDINGEPLIGVNVLVEGTNQGTSTDFEGRFQLEDISENAMLTVSYIGYKTQKIKLNGETSIEITLLEDSQTLDEVVVVGYGSQKKVNLTGSVDQISGKVLVDRPVTNIGQALQGTIGNLNISVTGDPGGPGTPATYNVRGFTSINGGEPLYIVDGVPMDNLQNINPNDVESISVLKDAASSAIYGARAAYGVIMVTTKRGEKNEKIQLNFSSNVAANTYTTIPQMANSMEYAIANNYASENSGLAPLYSEDALSRIEQYINDPGSIPVTQPDQNDPNRWDYQNANANNDWYSVYLKPYSLNQTYNLSARGGSDNTTYYLSSGFLNQGGQLRYGDDLYQRFNFNSTVRTQATDWLSFELRTKFSSGKKDTPFPYADLQGNWFHLAGTRRPTWPVRNPDGVLSHISALTYPAEGGRSISNERNLWLSGATEIDITKDWKVNIDYTWNGANNYYSNHDAFVYAYGIDGSKYSIGHSRNAISKQYHSNSYNSLNAFTSYEKELGNHYFKILVGQQLELFTFSQLNGTRYDLITDEIPAMGVATGDQFSSDGVSEYATMGTFGRFNYNYNEIYLLELNARYDGTSKFPEGDRFGIFPSVSVGYNIAKEQFWDIALIDNLKFRGSYGALGNQDVRNYLYLSTIGIGSNLSYLINNTRPNYLGVPGLVSANLTWEKVTSLDFGIDVSLMKNKLDASFTWYKRTTSDMLSSPTSLPAVLGAGVPLENNADLETKGFELSAKWRDNIGSDFNYNIGIVLSNYSSVITKISNNPNKLLNSYYEGGEIGEYWGYETVGIINSQEQVERMISLTEGTSPFYKDWGLGDIEYRDLNGDGTLDYGSNTLDDHGDLKLIGNSTPKFPFGITLGGDWKGLYLDMFWQGVAKRDVWLSGTNFWGWLGGYGSAVWKSTLDYWTPENTDSYWPKPYSTREISKNQQVQTRYLQNAAYLRLKNIQIGYNLPNPILNVLKMRSVRMFLSGENVITISEVNENFDPEAIGGGWGSGKIYPLLKSYSFGLNIGL